MGQPSADDIAAKMHEIDQYLHDAGSDVSDEERAELLGEKDKLEGLRRKVLSGQLSVQEADNYARVHRMIDADEPAQQPEGE